MKTIPVFLLVWLITATFGCDRQKGERLALSDALASDSLVVIDDDDVQDLPSDAVFLDSATIEGGVLLLSGGHSGGCEDHDLQLFGSRNSGESEPPTATIWLAHDAKGDSCEALVSFDRAFDLIPLENVYLDAYGGEGSFLIDIRTSVGPYGSEGEFDSAGLGPLSYEL